MKAKFVLMSILVVLAIAMLLPAAAGAKGNGASVWRATLTPVNAMGGMGDFHAVLNQRNGQLIISLHVTGVGAKNELTAAITGFAGGTPAARLPGASADANGDGIISNAEGAAFTGAPIVWLERFGIKKNLKVNFHAKLGRGQIKKLDPIDFMLGRCAVVVYGCTVSPAYGVTYFDPTAPAVAGLIHR